MADPRETRSDAATIGELEKSVAALESRISEQIRRAQRGTRAILVVGVIFVVALIAYLSWATNRIAQAAKPEVLAESIIGAALKHEPIVVDQLEQYLRDSAPANVRAVRDEIMLRVPDVRVAVEQAAAAGVDIVADRFDQNLDSLVDELLSTKKKEIQALLAMAADQKRLDELEKIFKASFEEQLAPRMDDMLEELEVSLAPYGAKLDRLLQPDEKLTPTERREKRIIAGLVSIMDDSLALMVDDLKKK